MARVDIPSLDNLSDSPITSPTPLLGSALPNNIPGSALAERIFNDPEAWEVLDDDDDPRSAIGLPLDQDEVEEELAWLEDEIKRFSPPITPVALRALMDEPSLPDEDIPTLPKLNSLHVDKSTTGYQELVIPKSVQPDKYRITPRPGPIALFPVYVHDPPGELDAPRQEYLKDVPGLGDKHAIRPISLAPLFGSDIGTQDPFGGDLNVHFGHILDGTDETRAINGTMQQPCILPSSSESSSSSSSGSESNCLPQRFNPPPSSHDPPTQVTSASGLSVPASAATSIISPFKVYSASTTLSFLEWHGIYPESPLVKAGAAVNGQAPEAGVAMPLSATMKWHLSPQWSCLTQSVSASQAHDGQRGDTCVVPDAANTTDTDPIPSTAASALGKPNDDTMINEWTPSRDQPATPRKPSFPENSRRAGIIFDSPDRRRPNAQLLSRESPKPPPLIPLPDIPSSDAPPVPPKDAPVDPSRTGTPSQESNNRVKVPIRRLPSVPRTTKSAAPDSESAFTCPLSSISHIPPRAPPHTSTHAPRCPTINTSNSIIKTPRTSARSGTRFNTPDTATTPSLSARSPPCPAGPRRRGYGNNTTPIKSAWYTQSHGSESKAIMSMVNATSSPPTPMVTVSRSVSAPRGLPGHGHSRSE